MDAALRDSYGGSVTVLFTDAQADAWQHAAAVWTRKLDAVDERLGRGSEHLAWTGARYLDFQGRMTGTRDAIVRAQHKMALAAQLLAEVAASVKAERAQLWRDENLVLEIVQGQSDPAGFLRKCGYTAAYWPESYDTEWADLRKKAVALAESQHPAPGLAI